MPRAGICLLNMPNILLHTDTAGKNNVEISNYWGLAKLIKFFRTSRNCSMACGMGAKKNIIFVAQKDAASAKIDLRNLKRQAVTDSHHRRSFTAGGLTFYLEPPNQDAAVL